MRTRKFLPHLLPLLTLLLCQPAPAQTTPLRYQFTIGYNLGGTLPMPLPASIRSIDAFRPTASLAVGGIAALPLGETWSIATGLRFENKGMDADVTVKSYRMEMARGSSQLDGLFTGHVQQQITQWMLTLPLTVNYQLKAVNLKFGPYLSLLISKGFSGIASNGYLRQGDPTGAKIEIGDKEGQWATYDFSDDLRPLQWGVVLGADWLATPHWGLSAELQWGLSGIFSSDFKTIEQPLYPVYGSLGLLYRM